MSSSVFPENRTTNHFGSSQTVHFDLPYFLKTFLYFTSNRSVFDGPPTKVSKQFVLKNRSMLNPIKKEIERLAQEILIQKDTVDVKTLLEQVQALYKQLIIWEHFESQKENMKA